MNINKLRWRVKDAVDTNPNILVPLSKLNEVSGFPLKYMESLGFTKSDLRYLESRGHAKQGLISIPKGRVTKGFESSVRWILIINEEIANEEV